MQVKIPPSLPHGKPSNTPCAIWHLLKESWRAERPTLPEYLQMVKSWCWPWIRSLLHTTESCFTLCHRLQWLWLLTWRTVEPKRMLMVIHLLGSKFWNWISICIRKKVLPIKQIPQLDSVKCRFCINMGSEHVLWLHCVTLGWEISVGA